MPRARTRSVAELLPRAFDELELGDVAEILERVGEEGESLFFERKRQVTGRSLAKSCAAFANTYGGLLVVGVEDESDELVGVEVSGEPQVWVKDVLRAQVLPMPAFRARRLELGGDSPRLAVLLVLVEESSTTPHLLTGAGAIYVRNPGSSDPVPIADQGRLLELTRRGREARAAASEHASKASLTTGAEHGVYTLVLAPTGAARNAVRELYSGRVAVDRLNEAAEALHDVSGEPSTRARLARPKWSFDRVTLTRSVDRGFSQDPEKFVDEVSVGPNCDVQLQRWLEAREPGGNPEPHGPQPVFVEQPTVGPLAWFAAALRRAVELALELGGHGDAFVVFRLSAAGRYVFYADSAAEQAKSDLMGFYELRLHADPDRDRQLVEELRTDIRRSIGAQPSD